MRTVDLIHRKRDGEELSSEEIAFLVDGYTSGTIPDYQMASFLMSVFFSGMTDREVSVLTERMVQSGNQSRWRDSKTTTGRRVFSRSTVATSERGGRARSPEW